MSDDLIKRMAAACDASAALGPRALAMHPDDIAAVFTQVGVTRSSGSREFLFCGIPVIESTEVARGHVNVASATDLITAPVSSAQRLGAEFHELADTAAQTADAIDGLNDVLAVSGRMLPPPEFCDQAADAAAAAGMRLEWCQHVSERAGRTDTWAHVTTRRGHFDVRPARGQSWTEALADAGVVIALP